MDCKEIYAEENFTKGLIEKVDSEAFRAYALFLARENEKYNLTSIDENDTLVKHFADSAAATELLSNGAYVCDIGSGAGFPAMVLKLLRPDLRFTLLDAAEKKTNFLKKLSDLLGVAGGLEIKHCRAEQEAALNRAHFDAVTARAVAPLSTLLEYSVPLLKPGGIFVAYKGAGYAGEVAEASRAANLLGAELSYTLVYSLEANHDRALLVYAKTGETPQRYPRKNNNPRRKPL